MTHRVKSVIPLDNNTLSVMFQNGVEKEYDMRSLYSIFPQFKVFETIDGLFQQVKVDVGGYGLSWNDELDLDAEEIWDNGIDTGKRYDVDILDAIGVKLAEARNASGITQKQLAERTGIYQADISKIEKGKANPSVVTLKRLAEGMGLKLSIEFKKSV